VLWDDPDVGRLPDPTYSVGELAGLLDGLLRGAFPGEIWVRGEIHDLSRPPSGHVYFTLVDDSGPQRACLSVMLSAAKKDQVNRALKRAGGAVRMTDGTEVRLRGRIDWYAGRGQLQLRMSGIDVEYTLGALELARAELLARLAEEGLLDANRALPMPLVPLRVGLVTSAGSAAAADALDELRRSGLRFEVVLADSRVQGADAPASLRAAIAAVAARGVDVVALVRGGGARTDLAAFDDEQLARAIATCPVPVVTGIGHEIDRSVADEVAHVAAKTPTACAAVLVDRVRTYLTTVEDRWARTARRAAGVLGEQDERVGLRAAQASRAARHALAVSAGHLDHAARRARRGASVALDHADSALERSSGRATGAARHHLRAAEVATARGAHRVAQRAPRVLASAEREVAATEARVRALDPARTLARGWSITRLDDGTVVRDAAQAPAGTVLRTIVHRGQVRSRSEPDDPTVDPDG
jgi:exodeoxyribonuclease VII large subunit